MPELSLSPSPAKRRRTSQGEQTYQAILQRAMDIASVEGLEGLSIGRLAGELTMSKSGLFAHFGSKEELQLATITAARALVIGRVVRPALRNPKGIQRLQRLCAAWLNYTEQNLFPGGCFFAMTSVEFKSRPGAVRDRWLRSCKSGWRPLGGWFGMLSRWGKFKRISTLISWLLKLIHY